VIDTPSHRFRVKLQQARAKFFPIMPLTVLAEKMGLPYDRVKYWQYTGNIPSEVLGELSDALGVDMEYWRV
jgi:hypothetical protein